MKAQLTAAEVMRNDHGWIRLEPHEIEALRRRAAHETLVTRLRLDPPADEPNWNSVVWSSGWLSGH